MSDELVAIGLPIDLAQHYQQYTKDDPNFDNSLFDLELDIDIEDTEEFNDYSIYENRTGLAEDMKFLASMPELCDITFLVGETREPVCAVKAVLASRSRVFHKLLYGQKQHQIPGSGTASGNAKDTIAKKKESPKDTKLKLFLKRSSEPILNGLPFNQQQPSMQTHQTMIIEEFEPDVFRQLIEYIHTGCVTLQARTLLVGLCAEQNSTTQYMIRNFMKTGPTLVSKITESFIY